MIAPLLLAWVLAADVPDFAPLDQAMSQFLVEHDVPGMSLAVARDGRLIYARGFGYSDREAKAAMQPDDRFRLASVSKPITGLAIMKLVQQGKLSLDQPVFAYLGYDIPADGDERLKQVTVRHLLHHLGGWSRERSFDPMFRPRVISKELNVPLPPDAKAIIRYMLKRPLQFDPGQRYSYSNFGYCILGEIIEKASGMGYEAFVKQAILEPAGVTTAMIGRSRRDLRQPGEVVYYPAKTIELPSLFEPDRLVPAQYGGWDLEVMAANGGWIASAPDLVRLMHAIDRADKPILEPKICAQMWEKPTNWPGMNAAKNDDPVYYGAGWLVRPNDKGGRTVWHNGRLDGTATLWARRADGITFAVLFNGDAGKDGKYLGGLIEPPLHKALDQLPLAP